jgi:uncharacterized protein (TIGR03435 family)
LDRKIEAGQTAGEVSGAALVVARNGPKFHEYRERQGDNSKNTGEVMGRGKISGRRIFMAHLADYIANVMQFPVLDKTNLSGFYEITLEWNPDIETAPNDAGPNAPSLKTALDEQLGLRLQPQKVPIQLFVIDHIERPSEN